MERLEYCRVPGMPGVEVLLAERSARLWRVYHETYAICSLLRLGGAVTRCGLGRAISVHCPFRRPSSSAPRPTSASTRSRISSSRTRPIRCCSTPLHASMPRSSARRAGLSASRAVLVRARDALRQRYAQAVSLGELAALSGLSRYHLVRAFARGFGLTPHAYQIHFARQLSARGGSSL